MVGRTNSSAGGGLVLHVVGGTTQPSDVKENTIWVNTSDAITSWVIQYDEPENPTDGMVWIKSQSTANNILNVAKRGLVEVGIGTVKQYDGTNEEWSTMTGKVYVNGTWTSLELFLTQGNQFNEKYTWTLSKSTSSDSQLDTSNPNYFAVSTRNGQEVFHTDNPIDLTDVHIVRFDFELTNSSNLNWSYLSVSQTTGSTANAYDNAAVKQLYNSGTVTQQKVDLDVTSLEGEYYINLGGQASQAVYWIRIYSIQLI